MKPLHIVIAVGILIGVLTLVLVVWWYSGRLEIEKILAGDTDVVPHEIRMRGGLRTAQISDEETLQWLVAKLAVQDMQWPRGLGFSSPMEVQFSFRRTVRLRAEAEPDPPTLFVGYEYKHGLWRFYRVPFDDPPRAAKNLIEFLTLPEYRHGTWVNGFIVTSEQRDRDWHWSH